MKKDYMAVTNDSQEDDLSFVDNFWSELWNKNADLPNPKSVTSRDEFRLMQPVLRKVQTGDRILDSGCGMGEWTVYLNQLGYQTTGLDISERTIMRLKTLLPQYEFVRGDIRNTDFPENCFDVLFSWGAFEHFENGPGECLRESFRILKPGGRLLITVPFDNWRHILTRIRSSRVKSRANTDAHKQMRFYQWRFIKSEIEDEIVNAGFEVLWTKPLHKEEGIRRWLDWGVKIKPSSLLYTPLFKIAKLFMPSNYLAHMIMTVAYKPE
jgi:SAM-dependent methyltransferase